MALNPAWADITRRWSSDPITAEDFEDLPETEKHRMVAFYVAYHRQLEATWRQIKQGMSPDYAGFIEESELYKGTAGHATPD